MFFSEVNIMPMLSDLVLMYIHSVLEITNVVLLLAGVPFSLYFPDVLYLHFSCPWI